MRYKNVSGVKQTVIGVGEVEPNGIIETDLDLNPNFKLEEQEIRPIEQPKQQVQPEPPKEETLSDKEEKE